MSSYSFQKRWNIYIRTIDASRSRNDLHTNRPNFFSRRHTNIIDHSKNIEHVVCASAPRKWNETRESFRIDDMHVWFRILVNESTERSEMKCKRDESHGDNNLNELFELLLRIDGSFQSKIKLKSISHESICSTILIATFLLCRFSFCLFGTMFTCLLYSS